MAEDDEQRARAEDLAQLLSLSEEKFRLLIEDLDVGVIVHGPGSEVLLWNPRALELLGLTADDLAGRLTTDPRWNVVDEEGNELPYELRPLQIAATTRQPVRGVVLGVDRAGGDRVWLSVNVVPQLTPTGEVGQFIATATDVTEHRRAQQALQHVQRMESVGRIAAGIAHDFNNLLTIIAVRADIVKGSLAKGSAEAEDMAELLEAATTAAGLANRLLTYARPSPALPRPLRVAEVLDASRSRLERIVAGSGDFTLTIQEGLSLVRIDAQELDQVLVNLVQNAKDALAGGGRVEVEAREVALDAPLGAVPPGRWVRLSVADTGSGIEPKVIDRIFEPFFSTKEHGRGTGLGLSTVRDIVARAGGHIRVHSEAGKGTRFELYLRPDTGPVPTRAKLPAPVRPTGTVLVADGDAFARGGLARLLTALGHTVLEAGDTEAALRMVRSRAIDLVLTEVALPGGAGSDLIAAIREIRPATSFLYVTALAPAEQGADGAGGVPILRRPYSPTQIARATGELLGARLGQEAPKRVKKKT